MSTKKQETFFQIWKNKHIRYLISNIILYRGQGVRIPLSYMVHEYDHVLYLHSLGLNVVLDVKDTDTQYVDQYMQLEDRSMIQEIRFHNQEYSDIAEKTNFIPSSAENLFFQAFSSTLKKEFIPPTIKTIQIKNMVSDVNFSNNNILSDLHQLEELQLSALNQDIGPGTLPMSLKNLTIAYGRLRDGSLPPDLESLTIGPVCSVDHDLVYPETLTDFTTWNHSTNLNQLPPFLNKLNISYTVTFMDCHLPNSLTEMHYQTSFLDSSFLEWIGGNLVKLTLCFQALRLFNLVQGILPPKLRVLKMLNFHGDIYPEGIPTGVEDLYITYTSQTEIRSLSIPSTVTTCYLALYSVQRLGKNTVITLPSSITDLNISSLFPIQIPSSVTQLEFYSVSFSEVPKNSLLHFPKSITSMTFHPDPTAKINSCYLFPESLTYLNLDSSVFAQVEFKHNILQHCKQLKELHLPALRLKPGFIPNSVTKLTLKMHSFQFQVQAGLIPNSVIQLTLISLPIQQVTLDKFIPQSVRKLVLKGVHVDQYKLSDFPSQLESLDFGSCVAQDNLCANLPNHLLHIKNLPMLLSNQCALPKSLVSLEMTNLNYMYSFVSKGIKIPLHIKYIQIK
ncbi:hypothetical protein CYY_005536 [Polysphondylium violaceum]|uniref:FNIP repeat-containing protein n=1 Tax=Polysphondylium violaceum TaxID=133409 RepID=A0A8J4PTC6_9MYCE|nr:hypothetical protein CYY_005536 [Polysphondylium violaceum]